MLVPGSVNPLLLSGEAAAYLIERSLRFNSADSAYLNRTPAVASNKRVYTYSCWVKRTSVAAVQQSLLQARDGADTLLTGFFFGTANSLTFQVYNSAIGINYTWTTPGVFRDSSAWYHFVLSCDLTQASSTDAVKIYVNGTQQTLAFDTNGLGVYAPNDTFINSTSPHSIGLRQTVDFSNNYLADLHFIDGQALAATSFGAFDINNIWQPKNYTGTYGTNGFRLSFSDNSTAAALGTDSSGNGNTWTVNNISVAAGSGNDSLVDSPTSYGTDTGVGGEARGNYCVWNPLRAGDNTTITNGNLDTALPAATSCATGSIAVSSGKWYWEVISTAGPSLEVGIISTSAVVGSNNYPLENIGAYSYYQANGNKYPGSTPYGSSYTTNDVIGVALDMDAGTVTFYKNNVSQGVLASGLTGFWQPAVGVYSGGSTTCTANFGQRPFAYTAPTGFKALCTANFPTSAVANSSTAFDTVVYTGTGATLTPTSSLSFSPDLVWIKSRSFTYDHALYDTVRGATFELNPNTTGVETIQSTGLTAFTSNGFTLSTLNTVNNLGTTFVSWCWDAGSSTVTNNAGTISSQVRADPTIGVSIVTFTAPGSGTYTWGHGLGVVPQFIIVRDRSYAVNWFGFHASVCTTPDVYFVLNTNSTLLSLPGIWGSALPTSSVVGLTATAGVVALSTAVAYCFASVAGFSDFGTYTGNGSINGPFVYTGFRPKWLLIKNVTSSTDWWAIDSVRSSYNPVGVQSLVNGNSSESSFTSVDLLSNGFKIRLINNNFNASGSSYIYAAFAEHPFRSTRAR